jgi:DNA helicase-2/ATP-dependent DNA helicase PcrA
VTGGALQGSLERARIAATRALDAIQNTESPLRTLAEITGCHELGDDLDQAEERVEEVLAEAEQLSPDTVTIMTMHACKGTEAEWAILPAVEPGFLERDEVGAAKEERRRLLYVGMTRAKQGLFISYAAERYGPDRYSDPISRSARKGASSFILEMCERTGVRPKRAGAFLKERLGRR